MWTDQATAWFWFSGSKLWLTALQLQANAGKVHFQVREYNCFCIRWAFSSHQLSVAGAQHACSWNCECFYLFFSVCSLRQPAMTRYSRRWCNYTRQSHKHIVSSLLKTEEHLTLKLQNIIRSDRRWHALIQHLWMQIHTARGNPLCWPGTEEGAIAAKSWVPIWAQQRFHSFSDWIMKRSAIDRTPSRH